MYYWYLQLNWMNEETKRGISHFEAVKGKESGKKCTRIKLSLKLMEHDIMSTGFRSMLATLCKINIKKERSSQPVARYPVSGKAEQVTEFTSGQTTTTEMKTLYAKPTLPKTALC